MQNLQKSEHSTHLIQKNHLLSATYSVDCPVLQVAHHGSEENWFKGLADSIQPDVSVFSSDPDHKGFGHPHPNVLRDFCSYCATQVDKTNQLYTVMELRLRPRGPDFAVPIEESIDAELPEINEAESAGVDKAITAKINKTVEDAVYNPIVDAVYEAKLRDANPERWEAMKRTIDKHGLDKLNIGSSDLISELERSLIPIPTQEGREAAQARGVVFDSPSKLRPDQKEVVCDLVKSGQSIAAVARAFNVLPITIYRCLGEKNAL